MVTLECVRGRNKNRNHNLQKNGETFNEMVVINILELDYVRKQA